MAIDDREQFREFRRRIEIIEAMLSAILEADGDSRRRFSGLYPTKIEDYLARFSWRTRRIELPEDFARLIEIYYHRREDIFRELFHRIDLLEEEQNAGISSLSENIFNLNGESSKIQESIERINSLVDVNSSETHRWFALQSLGLDLTQVNITRYVPMRIYISEVPDGGVESLSIAINNFIDEFGFEVSDDFPGENGSWFKKWFIKTKDVISQPEVRERLGKIERAIELKGLGLPQAEIDEKQIGAISKLNESLEHIESAAFQVGSLLYVKIQIDGKTKVMARTLTHSEMIVLENNQGLLSSPATCMDRLAKLCRKRDASHVRRSERFLSRMPDGTIESMFGDQSVGQDGQLPHVTGERSDDKPARGD